MKPGEQNSISRHVAFFDTCQISRSWVYLRNVNVSCICELRATQGMPRNMLKAGFFSTRNWPFPPKKSTFMDVCRISWSHLVGMHYTYTISKIGGPSSRNEVRGAKERSKTFQSAKLGHQPPCLREGKGIGHQPHCLREGNGMTRAGRSRKHFRVQS